MDELEISGKRYISTRRAARDHRYHADYIGQLVRGGKVPGSKVGRAWYVDAAALAAYLGKEVEAPAPVAVPQPIAAPIIKKEARVSVAASPAVQARVDSKEKVLHVAIEEEVLADEEEREKEEQVIRMQKKQSLQYIPDDEPPYPALLPKETIEETHIVVQKKNTPQFIPRDLEHHTIRRPASTHANSYTERYSRGAILGLLLLGGGVLVLSTLLSSVLLYRLTVEGQTQSASIQLSSF